MNANVLNVFDLSAKGDAKTVRIVAMSDTHKLHLAISPTTDVPAGDVFLHCGDFANRSVRIPKIQFSHKCCAVGSLLI